MRKRSLADRRCSYLVALDDESSSIDDLRELAAYLSNLVISNFDVIVVDASSPPAVDRNCRVLRWVSRYFAAAPQQRDPVRSAIGLAACEKVIVAGRHVRYTDEALDELSRLLDLHEVVEPQDYIDPLPWWGAIETGRILVHRSLTPLADHGSTFAFRKCAIRGLRTIEPSTPADDCVRRLASQGAEVFSALEVFVRRIPPALSEWARTRRCQADEDLYVPAKAALFFVLLPIAIILGLVSGLRFAAGYAGAIAFTSFALAVRGRIGAATFFPWRTCLYAPLWVLERSISVYLALFWKVIGAGEPRRVAVNAGARGERVSTGESATSTR